MRDCQRAVQKTGERRREDATILNEDVQTLFDRERGVENDQTEAERQHIVAGADLEEIADGALFGSVRISIGTVQRGRANRPGPVAPPGEWCRARRPFADEGTRMAARRPRDREKVSGRKDEEVPPSSWLAGPHRGGRWEVWMD